MRQTFCDTCGKQIEESSTDGGFIIAPYTKLGDNVNDDVMGDYCGECATIVAESVREAFSETPDRDR